MTPEWVIAHFEDIETIPMEDHWGREYVIHVCHHPGCPDQGEIDDPRNHAWIRPRKVRAA